MKKIILPFLVLLPVAASLASCGNGIDNTKTQINIVNYTGGVGKKWLEEAIEGFQKMTTGIEYETGKKGVEIHYQATKSIDTSAIKTTPKMYFTEDFGFPHDLAGQGALMDLTDVVTKPAVDENGEEEKNIEDKIAVNYRKMLQYGGKYYGLPHYEWYPGLTYNKDLFDGITKAGTCFYLADGTTNSAHDFGGKTYYFVDTLYDKKTCGNDGVYGNDDDGLPSCLPEFLALCDYMKEKGVMPMICPGNHTDYSSHLLNGLVASLSTPEALESYQSFEGKINYVKGYTDATNYLFEGSGIPVPVVETDYELNKVAGGKDRADGYLTRQQVERYAATGVLGYLVSNKEDYFFPSAYDGSTDNRVTQKYFINNGFNGGGTGKLAPEIGMMCEGNYWVNEAYADGLFDTFARKNPGVERHLAWMPLPVNISEPVTEGNGRTCSLLDTGNSFCMVSKSLEGKPEEPAIKDFLRYIYSDSRLKAFTKVTGICKAAVDYDISDIETDMTFQKDVLKIKEKNGVRNPGHDNEIYYNHRNDFSFSINYSLFRDNLGVCFFDKMSKGTSAKDCFEATKITPEKWNDTYLPK